MPDGNPYPLPCHARTDSASPRHRHCYRQCIYISLPTLHPDVQGELSGEPADTPPAEAHPENIYERQRHPLRQRLFGSMRKRLPQPPDCVLPVQQPERLPDKVLRAAREGLQDHQPPLPASRGGRRGYYQPVSCGYGGRGTGGYPAADASPAGRGCSRWEEKPCSPRAETMPEDTETIPEMEEILPEEGETAPKASSPAPSRWYIGIELGMPFGVSTFTSFDAAGKAGFEGGVLGGYRISPCSR